MKFEKLIMLLKNLFNLAYMYVGHNNIAHCAMHSIKKRFAITKTENSRGWPPFLIVVPPTVFVMANLNFWPYR